MKIFSISILISVAFEFFLFNSSFQENKKGVYVIGLESREYGKKGRSFKLPDDSIFVSGKLAIEKVIGLEQFDFFGNNSVKESLHAYYIINFGKGVYKDIGKKLENKTEKKSWVDLKLKINGFNFRGNWYFNKKYKIKDTIYKEKKVKKITYTGSNRKRYDILLQPSLSKNRSPVFFGYLEERFKGDLIKMTITYPDKKGTAVYTRKFIPLKNHEVIKALDKLK